jgi:KDO2-lipid IV(A) lauroyltransferase
MADSPVGIIERTQTEAMHASQAAPRAIRLILAGVRAISTLPVGLRSVLGGSVGFLVGFLPLRERRFALLQLRVFLPEVSAFAVTPRVFANVGRTLMESLRLQPLLTRHDTHITCDSWDKVQGWLASERPVICLTAHTGNWDLLAAYVIARGVPLTTIGREARNPAAQAILRSIREGYGIETIWRSDRNGLKRLVQCIKSRRVVAALIDQDTRVESIQVPFLGASAKTPVSLITLGRKMNARFVTAFLFRTGFMRYSVFIEEIAQDHDELAILSAYHASLERLIRRYPDQWVWFHKRWRSFEEGKTLSSREYTAMLEERLRASQG